MSKDKESEKEKRRRKVPGVPLSPTSPSSLSPSPNGTQSSGDGSGPLPSTRGWVARSTGGVVRGGVCLFLRTDCDSFCIIT